MAALTMLLSWPWFWSGWAQARFLELRDVASYLISLTPLDRLLGQFLH
jgi:hypothetical protein